MLGIAHVVLRPESGIAECLVRLGQRPELFGITGGQIIRMEALRQDPVDAMDRLRISVDADLQGLVVVDVSIRHGCSHRADLKVGPYGVERRLAYSAGAKYPSVAVTTRPGSRGLIS